MKMKLNLATFLPTIADKVSAEMAERIKAAFADAGKVTVIRSIVEAETKEVGERTIKAYLTTRHVDRENESLVPKGWDLSEWKQSPSILEAHDYSRPQVGSGSKTRKDAMGVLSHVTFFEKEALGANTPDYFLMSKVMPLSFSIGFIPLERSFKGDPGFDEQVKLANADWPEFKKDRKRIEVFTTKALMLEASVVPVPANPNALQQKIASAVEAGKITEEEVQVVQKDMGIEPEKKTTIVVPDLDADDNEDLEAQKAANEKECVEMVNKIVALLGIEQQFESIEQATEWLAVENEKAKEDRKRLENKPPEVKITKVVKVSKYVPPVIDGKKIAQSVKNQLDLATGKV